MKSIDELLADAERHNEFEIDHIDWSNPEKSNYMLFMALMKIADELERTRRLLSRLEPVVMAHPR